MENNTNTNVMTPATEHHGNTIVEVPTPETAKVEEKELTLAERYPNIPLSFEHTRNGVTLTYELSERERKVKNEKTGKLELGLPYYRINLTKTNLLDYVKYAGDDVSIVDLQGKHANRAQGWMDECVSADYTKFDKDTFIRFADKMSARGVTISELKERREELGKAIADNAIPEGKTVLDLINEFREVCQEIVARERK